MVSQFESDEKINFQKTQKQFSTGNVLSKNNDIDNNYLTYQNKLKEYLFVCLQDTIMH